MRKAFLYLAMMALSVAGASAAGTEGGAGDPARFQAYSFYEQKRFEEAAVLFKDYVEQNPADLRAAFDYAALLSQLNRHDEAATVLENIHQNNPQHEAAYFRLGVEYVTLRRYPEAGRVFAELERSSTRDLALAATEANRRLQDDIARERRFEAERRVFDLAGQFKHQEVIDTVNALEKTAPLSFAIAMQRLYALQSLGQYSLALDLANRLALDHSPAPDLALLRADLLAQIGRRPEAVSIWRQIERDNAGTASAVEAARRLQAAAELEAGERVFDLARQQRHRDVVEVINDLEKKGPVSLLLEKQRIYAWQALGQQNRALTRANELAEVHPKDAELALIRAGLLKEQDRWDDAAEILRQVAHDHSGTTAAFEAERQLRAESARHEKNRAVAHIFDEDRRHNHRAVVAAIDELEKRGELDWILQLQRLYALEALGEYAVALEKAAAVAAAHPRATDLALLRSQLLAENDQRDEAIKLLQQLRRDFAGTPVAEEAARRLTEVAVPSATRRAEQHIFELAARNEHREVIAAVDELEGRGELSWLIQMQRLYALQALGETSRALELAGRMAVSHPEAADLALLRADSLIRERRWQNAAAALKQIKREHRDEPIAEEADRRLESIPSVANLDRWYWGEAYLSGDYLGRFGTLVGSGFVRHGTFVPHARWLQPFQEFRFSADTRSRIGGQRSVISDNFTDVSLGLRAQPLAAEYLYFYVSGGLNKDLLGRRDGGNWTEDFRAGVYGFKSWGPGTVLRAIPPGEIIPTTGFVPPLSAGEETAEPSATRRFLWRLDWFADAGADFSYYKRYADWIGYGQTHEGFRVFQLGSHAGFDMYAVQNISWDARGNYFDNLVELGPGLRWLWAPRRGLEVVLRGEWLKGYYMGRDDRGTRGNSEDRYDDFRAGLSVGVRW